MTRLPREDCARLIMVLAIAAWCAFWLIKGVIMSWF